MKEPLPQFINQVMSIIDMFDFQNPKKLDKDKCIWLKKKTVPKPEYDINALKK